MNKQITLVNEARSAKERADVAYKGYLDTHPEMKHLTDIRTRANKAVKEAEDKLREHCLSVYHDQGKDALPVGIGVRYSKSVYFEDHQAVDWALKYAPIFLDINRARLEKAIIAEIVTLDMFNVLPFSVKDKPTITLAKDLMTGPSEGIDDNPES